MKLNLLMTLSTWLALCTLTAQTRGQAKSKDLTDPYVAWAEGQEVEIRFYRDKTKAAGLTSKDLEIVKYVRFWGENWTRTIKDVKVNLKEVAELKFRALHAPPFTVKLLDGREAIINPIPKKISMYMVTGEYFQQDVVGCLDSPLLGDPLKATVMSGIIVFGDLPHSTGEDKTHRSLGESLDQFARIEVRGKPGPQATELSRMRVAYDTTLEAMGGSKSTSRELMEKQFGPGKPSDPTTPEGPRTYSLQSGQLEVHWKVGSNTVDYMYTLHGKDLPTAKADEPDKLAKQARELADADRAIILEYFTKMRDTLSSEEGHRIRDLLDRSQAQLRWTEAERRLMLGGEKK
jgi:hypothetical protein